MTTTVRSATALSIAFSTFVWGCQEGGTGPGSNILLLSTPQGDTVDALPVVPLTVEVRADSGTAVVFRGSTTSSTRLGGPVSSLSFLRSFDPLGGGRTVDTIPLDRARRATVFLRLGVVATEAVVTVVVPRLNDSLQVGIAIRPGSPKALSVLPSDTAMYVGRHYRVDAVPVDAWGNRTPATTATFTTESTSVAISPAGDVTSLAIGRANVTAEAAGLVATAWVSVVPAGRIAATRFRSSSDTNWIVLVNLDGSDYRSFPLDPYDVSVPAWHPGGSYLIASRRLLGSGSNGVQRLSALDTASGTWRELPGTPGTKGDGFAEFSRDGVWIYVANAPTSRYFSCLGSAIYRVRADGTGSVEQVGYDAEGWMSYDHPTLSPDGSRVALTVDANGEFTLTAPVTPPLGPTPQEATLTGGLPTGGHPRWSPVADELIMFGTQGMWLMPAGSTSVSDRRYVAQGWTSPTSIYGGYEGASWSPDGRWIVAKAAAGLILVEVATGRVLPLAFGVHLSYPAWRPS